VSDVDLSAEEVRLMNWLGAARHGEMDYMARHGAARARPAALVPGTLRVITARLNYWPAEAEPPHAILADSQRAYVARYALGRDYHKVLRQRLANLARRIGNEVGTFGHRVFTDSAPVLEVALAAKS
jgi:epoxyqueuosine reductase